MKHENPRSSDEAQIVTVIDRWMNALRTKDAAGVAAEQAKGVVGFTLAPPLQSVGTDSESLEAWFATWQGPIGYEIRNPSIAAGKDVAFCHGLARMSGRKAEGEVNLWFRLTLCLRRLGGSWKIVHSHESVPFLMDGSFKAAIDLQP